MLAPAPNKHRHQTNWDTSSSGCSKLHSIKRGVSRASLKNARLSNVLCRAVVAEMPTLYVQEVAKQDLERPDVGRSGAAGAVLHPDHPYAAVIIGGYAEYVQADAGSTTASTTPSLNSQGSSSMTRREVMDAWGFDATAGAWRAIDFAPGPAPAPRMAHQAVAVGHHVYVIGGWHPAAGSGDQFLNDIWQLDTRTWTWTELQPQGEQLPPISRFQAVAVGTHIYIHHHRCDDHILCLDLSQHPPVLQKVPTTGEIPSSRGLHSLTALPGLGKLVLYGGAPQKGPMLGDLYQLDLWTHVWARCASTLPHATPPHTRCSHGAAALPDGRHILYIGGAYYKNEDTGGGYLQVLDDAFLYDAVDDKWVPVASAAGLPPARNAAVLLPIYQHEYPSTTAPTLLLWGGWIPFVSTFNDSYLLAVTGLEQIGQ